MNRRCPPRSTTALLVLAFAGGSVAEEPVWHALPLPAGALTASAGSGPAPERWRWLLDLTHRLYVGPLSSEDRNRLLAFLGSGDPAPGGHPGNGAGSPPGAVTVPLPLPPETWRRLILRPDAANDVLRDLLTERAAGLTYRGLAQLDGPTLRAVAADTRALTAVSRRWYGPFSVFARSFRVRDGRVVPPGDPEATPLWETVVGESVRKPGAFLVKLLEKDGGRLAYLYDTIDQIDEPRRRFALGLWMVEPKRAGRFRALVGVFSRSTARWDGSLGRPVADVSRLLWNVRVTSSGAPAPPAGRGFWSAAFRDGDGLLEEDRTAPDDPVDAAALADAIEALPLEVARRRIEAVQFAQRAFADAPRGTGADQVAATRGLASYWTLVVTLERIGLTRPAAYAAALRRANSLERVAADGAKAALAQFQGALALVDRARLAGAIEAEAADELVSSLVSVEPSEHGYGCSVARWIEEALLPRFAAGVGSTADEAAEGVVARAVAGARAEAALPEIEWEGFRYRVDVGGAELTRLLEVRNRMGGPSLDAALAFCRAADGVAEAGPDGHGLTHRLERLRAAAGAVGGGRTGQPDPRGVAGAFVDAVERGGTRDAERLARPVLAAADDVLARVLASLVYAASLGAPDSTALLGGDPSLRHDFGAQGAAAWSLPEEVRGPEGWRVRGSLLGLDVGLARLALRRLTSDLPPLPPGLPSYESLAFAQGVALMNPSDLADEDRDALADSIRRGRERVARFRADGAGLEELVRDARLDPLRRNALAWIRLHEPEATDGLFSLDELVRLGRAEPGRRWNAWGAAALRCEGRLGLRFPAPGSRAEVHSQVPVGQGACYSPDLTLRIAVALQELGLPARLAKAVLAYAVQDMIDSVRPAHLEDWSALTAYARGLSQERIEDYVAALVDGPLTPIEDGR